MKMNAKIRVITFIFFIASAIAALGFPSRQTAKPEELSFADYIEKVDTAKAETQPLLIKTLAISSVSMNAKPSGGFKPENAFKGKFLDELRTGALVYFKKRNIFSGVDMENGELMLKVNINTYEGGVGLKNRMSLKVDLKLFHVKSGNTVLAGEAESFLDDCAKDLKKPVVVELGGKEIILREGSLRMAEISYHLLEIMDKYILDNQNAIVKRIEALGG